MSDSVILWMLGAAVTALCGLFGHIAAHVNTLSTDQAKLAQHVAENYVRGHELSEVKRAVSDLTVKVDQLIRAVHEMIGRQAK